MILFVGLQAAGKSEFYRRNFFDTHMRINLDMLKTRKREETLVKTCLQSRQPFVVDNTNPTKADRQRYISLAKEFGFTVKGYYFETDIKDALKRNAKRQGKQRLPDVALYATRKKLQAPDLDEGFTELFTVSIDKNGKFVVKAKETT